MVPVAGKVIAGDWMEVVPPSMSLAPTAVPAVSPVTRQLALPPAHSPSCRLVPPELVGCGLPRAQAPVLAVSVPLGLTVHPRAASKSSEKTWVTPPIGW